MITFFIQTIQLKQPNTKSMKSYIFLFLIFCASVTTLQAQINPDTTNIQWHQGYLDIHHIVTGSGVSTFFALPDGTTMLVDAGDIGDVAFRRNSWPFTYTLPYPNNTKTAGQWIADYIQQILPNRPVIDYALITHYHDDHMGIINAGTKTATNGAYKLSGITEVGDLVPIKKLIDRNYPYNNFPTDLKVAYKNEPSIFLNLQKFIEYQKQTNRLVGEQLKVGAIDQIVLKNNPSKYPNFKVRGVKANGTIWTGDGNETFEFFTADSVLDAKKRFNENPLSLAIKLSYGKFDYFTGGDNTGLQGYGLPTWFDVETPISKAVGKVEVTTLDHHGCRDATNENFLRNLQPQVVVEQTWSSNHPGEEVVHRLISDHIYKGKKNLFATNIQEATKAAIGFWFTDGFKSMFGHTIIRVLPGGETFYVLIAETIDNKLNIKKAFGPFQCQ